MVTRSVEMIDQSWGTEWFSKQRLSRRGKYGLAGSGGKRYDAATEADAFPTHLLAEAVVSRGGETLDNSVFMPENYEVQSGDCMSSIAFDHGFFWETLWNLPENADLKTQRKNPNVLMPGDIVHIPDLTPKDESRPTDQRHKFRLKGIPEILNMKLLDAFHQPRANVDYTITIDGNSQKGTTDADGSLKMSIPPGAMTGKLVVASPGDKDGKPIPGQPKNQVMNLQLGDLNPVTEVSGVKARLTNLGFYMGPIDENLDDDMKRAIRSFQRRKGLAVTGESDAATQSKLLEVHGH